MNINRKYIIIFGTLILLLVIITGAIIYYKEKTEQTQISDAEQYVVNFSQDYPTSLSELSNFLFLCNNAVFSDSVDMEEIRDQDIREAVCMLEPLTSKVVLSEDILLANIHIPSFSSLNSIISFNPSRYIGISVNFNDVIREYNPSLLQEERWYVCSISEPSWADPSLQMNPKQTLIFDEGDVLCGSIKADKSSSIYFSGFIPQAESLSIKQYLVDEQTVSEVLNKQSFSEIKEILKDYPIIWQMEKPINF
jgi:hypothetical protein